MAIGIATETRLEINMGTEPAYTVKVGDLAQRLGLRAIDLVRLCGISGNTANKAVKNGPIDLDSCYKIYTGLKKAGYDLEFKDVVEID